MKKIRQWICKNFGHKFDPILLCMFEIEHESLNREQFKDDTISCLRCGAVFKHKFKK